MQIFVSNSLSFLHADNMFSESRLRSGYRSVFVSGNDFQLLPLTREILSSGGRLSVCFSGCSANEDLFV